MTKILQLFQDDIGQFSSIRFVMILWMIGVLAVWGFNSVLTRTMQPIPESVIILLGMVITGKAAQKTVEVKQ